MAKKKLVGDPFFPDDSLNLPDFNFDIPEQKNDRTPVTSALRGIKDGIKSSFKDSSFIKRLLRETLPPVYGEIENIYSESTEGLKKLYNSAAREIKPELNYLSKSVDRLVPAERKKIKGTLDKITKATQRDDSGTHTSRDELNQKENNLSIELGRIFSKENEKQQEYESERRGEERVNSRIKDSVELGRHRDSIETLSQISIATQSMSKYQQKITNAYQRKSLELQMRSYWLASDSHILQKATSEKLHAQLEAVAKNTALPEYVKIHKSEAWKEQLRNRFITDMNTGLFGKHSNFIRNVFDGLSVAVKDKAMNAASLFSQGASLVDTADATNGMDVSKAEMAGGVVGGIAAQSLAYRAGRGIKRILNKSARVSKTINDTDYNVRNLPQKITSYVRTPTNRSGVLGILEDLLKSGLSSGVRNLSPDVRLQTDNALNINPDTKGSLRSASIFNNQSNKSLNEIIPGYLSRIFRELQVMRSGDNTMGLTTYDFTKNRFLEATKVSRNVLKSVITPSSKEAHNDRVSKLMGMIDRDNTLSKEERTALGSYLTKQNIKGTELSPQTLVSKKFFDKSKSKDIDSDKIAALFRSYFKEDPKKAKGYRFSKRKNEINSVVGDLGKDINDSRAFIQELVNLGQYDVLRNAGLIDETNQRINLDAIVDGYSAKRGTEVRKHGISGSNTLRDTANNAINLQSPSPQPQVIQSDRSGLAAQTQMADAIRSLVGKVEILNEGTQTLTDTDRIQNVQNDNFALIASNTDTTNNLLRDMIALLNDKLKIVINRFSRNTGQSQETDEDNTTSLGDIFREGVGNIGDGISDAYNSARGRISSSANAFRRDSTVGRVIGSAAGAVGGALSGASKVGKFWWNSTAKPLAKFTGTLMGNSGRMVANQVLQMRDVFVEGEDEPRLTLRKLKAGEYFDAKTGDVVKTLRQLKNGVVDKDGNIVLSKLEATKAYTRNVKGGVLPVLGQVIKSTMGVVGSVNSAIIGGVITPSIRAALSLTKKTLSFGKDMFDRATDVYVKGDTEPTLLAITMRAGGYVSKLSEKVITKPSQIDGPILDKEGNIILSEDMLKKGIVDKHGNTVGSPLFNFARFATSGIRATFNIGRKVIGGVNNLIGGAIGGAGGLLGDFFSKMSTALGGGKSYDILVQIRDVLNDRLPVNKRIKGDLDGDGIKDGSTADIRRKRRANKKTGLEDDPKALRGGVINTGRENTIDRATRIAGEAKDKIAGWLGFGEGGGPDIDIDTGRRRRRGARRTAKAPGRLGRLMGGVRAAGAKIGHTKGFKAGVEAGKKLGTGIGRKASGIGLGKLAGGGLKLLGGAGAAYGLYNAAGNLSEGNYGSAALDLGLAGVSGATMLGGGAALSGLGSAALGAGGAIAGTAGAALTAGAGLAGTALAGAGALLASPVVLGALAVGALGYGAYKLYNSLNKANMQPLTRLRMAQYGFGTADEEYIPKVQAFEKEMIQYVKFDKEQPTLELDDKNAGKLITYFGFEAKDSAQLNSWISWVQNRFKPVFLTHMAALKSLGLETKLTSIDSEKTEVVKKYFDLVKFQNGPYGQLDSPFAGLRKLAVAHALVNYVIDEVRKDIDKRLEDDKVTSKTTLNSAAAGALTTVAAKQKLGLDTNASDIIDSQAIDKANEGIFSKFVKGVKTSALTFLPVAAATSVVLSAGKSISKWMGYSVDADEAVRFKTYGLIEMDRAKVVALRNLEEIVSGSIKFGADGNAIWEGTISDVLSRCKGDFGIPSKASVEAKAFVSWFTERFSTTYLYYRSLLKQTTGTSEQDKAEKALKPEDRYDVSVKLAALEVWSKQISPWMGYVMATDSNSTKPNLKILQEQSKNSVLRESKASVSTTAKSTGLAAALNKKPNTDNDPTVKPVDTSKFNSQESKMSSVGAGEDGGVKIATISTPAQAGSVGTLSKTVGGPLSDGSGGDVGITFYKDAKLNGVNPAMLKLFKGMVQEYYEATGKKVQVNSGYRSIEEQTALHKSDPKKAAKPGRSLHEFGLAIDIQSEHADTLEKLGLMRKYGFTRPVGGEPWHLEMSGTQLDIGGSKKDPAKATQLIDASPGKGGGGWGTKTSSGKYSRNDWFAKELFHKASNSASIQDQEMAGEKISAVGQNDLANVSESAALFDKIKSNGPAGGSKYDLGNKQTASNLGIASGDMVTNSKDSKPGQAEGYTNTTGTGTGKGYTAVKDTISDASRIVGVDERTMVVKAALESSFNPNAQAGTSNAAGLYQFIPSTWNEMLSKYGKKYGIPPGTKPSDARANAILAAQYMKDNGKILSRVRDGGEVNATDQYMAHFFGPGGASSMIKASSDTIAANVLPAAAQANKTTFYNRDGTSRTVAQVREFLDNKINTVLKKHGIDETQFSTILKDGGTTSVSTNTQTPAADVGAKNPSIVKTSFKETSNYKPIPQIVPPTNTVSQSQLNRDKERQRAQLSDAIKTSTYQSPTITSKPQPQLVAEARSLSSSSDEILKSQLNVQESMLVVLKDILGRMDLSDVKASLESIKGGIGGSSDKPTPDNTGNYNMTPGSTGRPKATRIEPPINFSRMT